VPAEEGDGGAGPGPGPRRWASVDIGGTVAFVIRGTLTLRLPPPV
jgi:hypothetical protein